MKPLLLILLAPLVLQAAGLEAVIPVRALAHPVQAYHSIQSGRRLLAIADAALQDVNVADYATTRRGAFPGTGGCELNPLLTKAPCQIDVPRFTGIKLAVAAFGAAQWAPVFTGWGGERYVRAMTLIDLALAVPLAIADANNIVQLTK
jgi:hypothetical protein